MVRPMAQVRFGADAWVPSDRLLRQFARRGVLHLVSLGGLPVAGTCTVRRGDGIWLPVGGIRGGDPALLKAGALAAAMGLTYAWARNQGCRRVDAGRTSCFISDGVAWSKRNGAPPARSWCWRRWSARAPAAFAREPVLVETGDGPRGTRGSW
jgi:hypothetical protein